MPGGFALESIGNATGYGRRSLFGAAPVATLDGDNLAEVIRRLDASPRAVLPPDVSFAGGWVGAISYEAGAALEGITRAPTGRPVQLGLYDTLVIRDHALDRWMIVGADLPESTRPAALRVEEWFRLLAEQPETPLEQDGAPPLARGPLVANMTKAEYLAKVEQAKAYIRAGDIYQVNLTQRFAAPCDADPLAVYLAARRSNPADFAAYLPHRHHSVICCSPELFLDVDPAGQVLTRPIKGTRRRGSTETEDQRLAEELLRSEKDRAELAMIIDLLRNDLGRVCAFGSVQVLEEARVEHHPTVLHLVGTIAGRLRPGVTTGELLRATLPGGSITGCPKIRAMQIIRELEPTPREVYCGAIGIIGLDGKMTLNVAIRTMILSGGQAHVYAGGAITADSDAESEYAECLAKAEGLLRSVGFHWDQVAAGLSDPRQTGVCR